MTAWHLPAPPDDIEGLTRWYAENVATIKAIDSALWHAKRRVKEYVRQKGPQGTTAGKVTLDTDGWDWDGIKVLEAGLPEFIKSCVLTVAGDPAKVYRAQSIIEEEIPDLEMAMDAKVDATEANKFIKLKGEVGEKLETCREQKTKLAVVPS